MAATAGFPNSGAGRSSSPSRGVNREKPPVASVPRSLHAWHTGGVPRLMRGVARGTIRAGLERVQREAAHEAPGMPPDAWDRFTLLLDWDGAALDALGLRGRTARYHVLVLDRAGGELGRIAQGETPLDAQIETVLGWLRSV